MIVSNFLIEMRDFIARELKARSVESQTAEEISEHLTITFRKNYGGIPLYLPKSKELTSRNDEIWSKFNGKNHVELCREYDLSYQQICKIIGIQRKKRQGDLFA